MPAARMIGQDVCVSCTYAVLLGAKSTQNRRGNVRESSACFPGPLCAMSDGNTAALAGKAPDPSAAMSDGNKVPKTSLSPRESEQPQADGEGKTRRRPKEKNTGSAAFPGVFRCLISFYARCICSTISASLSHSFWACTQSPASSRREMRVSRSFFCSSSSRYSLLKCFL